MVPYPTRRLNPSAMALQTGLVAYKHERTEAMSNATDPLEGYEVRDGIIVSPGKFEGERDYMPAAYDQYMNGFCDDDGEVIRVTLHPNNHHVAFIVDEQGFVCEVKA